MNGREAQLPKGWQIKKLVDLSSHLGDGLHGTPKYSIDGDYYFINGNNLKDGVIEFKESTKRVSIDEFKKYKKNLTDRTILVSINGTLGNVAFYNEEKIILGKSACYFNLLESVDKNFIKYILSSSYFLDYAHKEATGATIKNVSLKTMREFEIPLPPLPEQQRIVSILDEAFAVIERCRNNAEQNLRNAKELFESYLQGVFEKKGDGWEEKTLGEAFQMRPQKSEVKNKLKDNDYVTFLPMEDLGIGQIEVSGVKRKELKDVYSGYTYFAENDVLLAKITPCFENGKLGIARNLINGVGFGSSEYFVFRTKGIVLSEYLYYFLSQNLIKEGGKKSMGGAVGHQRVSKEWIEAFFIPFPTSVTEQQNIIQQLNTLQAETKKLEAIYQQKINDLEELKKSILQKAFSGELSRREFMELTSGSGVEKIK